LRLKAGDEQFHVAARRHQHVTVQSAKGLIRATVRRYLTSREDPYLLQGPDCAPR
jgi:hypothetical protein